MAINSPSQLPITGSSPTYTNPPSDCHHYETLGEVPWDIQKCVTLARCSGSPTFKVAQLTHNRYWQQRYDIFSRYDDGILMTDDAWFSVTPEPVAQYVF